MMQPDDVDSCIMSTDNISKNCWTILQSCGARNLTSPRLKNGTCTESFQTFSVQRLIKEHWVSRVSQTSKYCLFMIREQQLDKR